MKTANKVPKNLHPFPAKMAPELAIKVLDRCSPGEVVLDPMCGSGTVLREGLSRGLDVIGRDVDPLAVLLSRVGTRKIKYEVVSQLAEEVVAQARLVKKPHLPWVEGDKKTQDFLDFWFAEKQRFQLGSLAQVLNEMSANDCSDALRVSLSKTIVTKEMRASLARDTSHSRPHRVALENDYDVYEGFLKAANQTGRFVSSLPVGRAEVMLGDARSLKSSVRRKADLVITSPPYLNAIDYIRGHKMSLVWLGHTVGSLREIRSGAIGAESAPSSKPNIVIEKEYGMLPSREYGIVRRYWDDCLQLMQSISEVVVNRGTVVVVVGDSTLRGTRVRNSKLVERAGEAAGMTLVRRHSRKLPPSSRYLPPPSKGKSSLSKRMRQEVVLTLENF